MQNMALDAIICCRVRKDFIGTTDSWEGFMKRMTTVMLLAAAWLLTGGVAQAVTCQDLQWGDFIADHPDVDDACVDVVERDGIAYAKFNVTYQGTNNDASVKLRLHKPDGSFAVDTFRPPEGFTVELPDSNTDPSVASGETAFQNRPVGQSAFDKIPTGTDLRLYVPEGRWFVVIEEEVVVIEEVEPYVAPEPEVVVMPTTASHLPLIGLAGGLFLMLGGALGAARRRS
jgi:hypothetical protein